jgi:hypothetical protein
VATGGSWLVGVQLVGNWWAIGGKWATGSNWRATGGQLAATGGQLAGNWHQLAGNWWQYFWMNVDEINLIKPSILITIQGLPDVV